MGCLDTPVATAATPTCRCQSVLHVADSGDPLSELQDYRMREALVAAIKALPEREQLVMSMYYEQDMNLKEIAAVLEVTESRVCQLHSQSIARLRAKMRSH